MANEFNWDRARKNVEGFKRIGNIVDIENEWTFGDLFQWGASKVWTDTHYSDRDLGTIYRKYGILKGQKTGRLYYVGDLSDDDLQAIAGETGWGTRLSGWDLGTTDFNEAIRMLQEQERRFHEVDQESRTSTRQAKDKQISDTSDLMQVIKDMNRSKDAQAEDFRKQMTEMQKRLAQQAEDYNLKISSAFNTIEEMMNFMQDSSQTPTTIQTLYLDRQAKSYLPSSIRNRGIAGALGG